MPKHPRTRRSILAGSPIDRTEQQRAVKHILSESRRIANEYRDAVKAATNAGINPPHLVGKTSARKIGKRSVLRNPIAPRFRPQRVLKRQIYRLAREIDDMGALDLLIADVRRRGDGWKKVHRPHNATVIDWTVRLLRWRLPGQHTALGLEAPTALFDGTMQSRMVTELNFAFEHDIEAEVVTMFIDELGGHELISAHLAEGTYDFTDEEWVSQLQRTERYKERLRTTKEMDHEWKIRQEILFNRVKAKSAKIVDNPPDDDGWDVD